MNDEDASNYLISCLRDSTSSSYSGYGYDIYLPNLVRTYVRSQEAVEERLVERRARELSPHFYAAAWELCRRGIIRPGIRVMGAQATEDGSGRNGYSITPFGRAWIAEADRDDFVPTEPGRFAAMLQSFQARLGAGFYERAQEAIRCYGARAYLACCAMCGAAAESILLALAIARSGDEERVLRTYGAAGGRGRVENLVIGTARPELHRGSFADTRVC